MKYCPSQLWVAGCTLLLSVAAVWSAQGQAVRGKVVDAETGESLPAATIHVANTYRGTITNPEGLFELNPGAWPSDLVVRFMGYRTDTVHVTTPGRITVRLQPAVIELGSVTVTGEDPGMQIMREVIRRKQIWRADLDSYEAQAYARLTFANDSGIVAITESASQAWWARGRGLREIKLGNRDTGNIPFGDQMPAAAVMLNLYDDDIDVGGHTLVGVTHPDALDSYDFSLLRSLRIDDVMIYDIGVSPKHRLVSGFVGQVRVLAGEYAMVDAELQPGEAFLFPPPITRFEVIFRQQFFNFDSEAWLPVDLRSETAVKISFGPLLSFPTVRVDVMGRFTDYRINVPVPDSLFEEGEQLVVDSAAVASGEVFGEEGVVVPYTPVEELAIASIDSTQGFAEQYAPQGPMGRMMRMQRAADEQHRRFSTENWPDITPRLYFNRVDGFHGGVGLSRAFGRFVEIRAGGGWSSHLEGADQWSYDGSLRLMTDRDKGIDLFLEGGYQNKTELTFTSTHNSRLTNSISVLVVDRPDYFDYYRLDGTFVTAGLENGDLPISASVTWRSEHHGQLPTATSYDFRGRNVPQRPNVKITEGRLNSITFKASIGEPITPVFGNVSGVEHLSFTAEHTTGGSDLQFQRYFLSGYWRQPIFLRRRLLPATLDLHAYVGTSRGDLPPQRVHIIERGIGYFRPFGTLRAVDGIPHSGRQVAAIFWEQNFRTVPFELMGLRILARNGYNLLIFGGHGWIKDLEWEDYQEVGISLSGLFGLFRLDIAKSLNGPGFGVGWGVARVF